MHSSPSHAFTSPPAQTSATAQPNLLAERAYQGLTIAAMLVILASLLSFW
jgi:hypothetical protein